MMQDTSVGKYRAFEAGLRLKNRKAFRKGRSERFLYAADQIERFDTFSEIQKLKRSYEYRNLIDLMLESGEITPPESDNLIDYLESKYPGGVLPEYGYDRHSVNMSSIGSFSRDWTDTYKTIPVKSDNRLVNIGQQYLGLDEEEQSFQIQELLRRGNIECDPQTTPWCASYVGSVLEQAGYEGLKGADRLRARKYIKVGKPGTGAVGDLAVFKGHVGIIADVIPARHIPIYDKIGHKIPEGAQDIMMLGGNQGDGISLKWIPHIDFESDSFLGFRTPVEKKQQPYKITGEKWIPEE